MRLRERLPYRVPAVLLALSALAALVWWLASRPVLFHSRLLATAADRACADYSNGETGIPILNPFRSRAPERAADAIVRAVSKAQCLPDWNERTCKYLTRLPLRAESWRPVDRYDSGEYVMVIFGLYTQEQARRGRNGCLAVSVQVQRTGATWRFSGFSLGALRAAKWMR